jgi:DNA topoisomerase-3
VNFEFAPSKFSPRPGAVAKAAAVRSRAPAATPAAKAAAKKAAVAAKRVPAAKKTPAAKAVKAKAPRKPSSAAGKAPSASLAAVIGSEAVSRPEVVKKLWDYIKAQGLQDPKDKRTILADAKLQAVFGKPSINMFELAGIVGKHLL